MRSGKWPVTVICLALGLLMVVQLRTQDDLRQMTREEEWDYVVADLVEGNTRLRSEIEALEQQLADLEQVKGSGAVLQSLVSEANNLRIANGLVAVSGPGVEVVVSGPVSVLDLQDLINELRNAGAEALALNGQRLIAWSAIGTDGEYVTVDGQPVSPPYELQAIGDAAGLEGALIRPGGLVDLLEQADSAISIVVWQQQRLTLPVCGKTVQFEYARAAR